MKVRMKAARSFRYATRMLEAGDEFEATRQDARVLSAIGNAVDVIPAKPKPAPKEVDASATGDEPQEEHDDAQEADDEPVKRRRGRPAKPRD